MKEPALCDSLVKGFKKTRQLGFTHDGLSAKGVDKSWKDSEDASLNCFPIQIYAKTVRAYRQHVMSSVKAYMDCFPILENGAGKIGFLDPPSCNITNPVVDFSANISNRRASASVTASSHFRRSSTTSKTVAAPISSIKTTQRRRKKAKPSYGPRASRIPTAAKSPSMRKNT